MLEPVLSEAEGTTLTGSRRSPRPTT